jgi:hypothetical protein
MAARRTRLPVRVSVATRPRRADAAHHNLKMAKTFPLILCGALLLVTVGYLGYRAGRVHAALETSWLGKEHTLLAGSMERIEQSLSRGETGAVVRAVAAYNQQAKAATNDYSYYLAAMALWDQTTNRP